MRFSESGVEYLLLQGAAVEFSVGKKVRTLNEYFRLEPPIVRFEQDAFTEDNQLCRPSLSRMAPYDANRIEVWRWRNVNLSRESQTSNRLVDSIQHHVIQRLRSDASPIKYNVIFDDDGAGEIADIVALAVTDGELVIHMFHCKVFIGGETRRSLQRSLRGLWSGATECSMAC